LSCLKKKTKSKRAQPSTLANLKKSTGTHTDTVGHLPRRSHQSTSNADLCLSPDDSPLNKDEPTPRSQGFEGGIEYRHNKPAFKRTLQYASFTDHKHIAEEATGRTRLHKRAQNTRCLTNGLAYSAATPTENERTITHNPNKPPPACRNWPRTQDNPKRELACSQNRNRNHSNTNRIEESKQQPSTIHHQC
jgi:hypothetical protein